ncbi:MAG: Malectin protein [Candidatus Hydrogenedentes bacterium]|nr:Malectin protein [Candidatus Hydrogenedentota bacterium]
MRLGGSFFVGGLAACLFWCGLGVGATVQGRYYAHDAVEDAFGVIAPWYSEQNGQWDFRARIAAETLKRYPWTDAASAAAVVPAYVFNGHWSVGADGTIGVPALQDWDNGDLGQRAAYVLSGFVDYYRYTGDPAAIAHVSMLAEVLLDHCVTSADNPWPGFLISVPTRGTPYGACNPHGMIQLDIVAETGLALLRAYQLVGNERWFEAAKHWADLMAANRSRTPHTPPWNRYANPEDVLWNDHMTGGVAFLLCFFDELIRLGYTGADGAIVEAREAGVAYLRDELLPKWTVDDTWGRNYWDWEDPVQAENVTEFVVRYLMEHPAEFPNWRNDARNILSLFLNRTSVCPASRGDVYSGAWAYPESSSCCGRSLWYGPLELAPVWAQYGALAGSAWATEIARRQAILATYDGHPTGVSEDNIDGGDIVAGSWFKIAHPMALKHVLNAIAWMPGVFGANRENHIVRSTSVVTRVVYDKGRIDYATFDAPANNIDVVRLAFVPKSVTADGTPLALREDLSANGYRVEPLASGDCLVTIRHDGATGVRIEGDDPQRMAELTDGAFSGEWRIESGVHVTSAADAAMTCAFSGNQVRLIGAAGPKGGLAEVYLDGEKQLVGIDCWIPGERRDRQVLYYRNGLAQGEHTLKIVARGAGNPLSAGAEVYVEAVQYSDATGAAGYGGGAGPSETQRMIFGYPGREDYVDSQGNAWRPATEFIVRAGSGRDAVATSWWTSRRRLAIEGTPDPELYRYGVHGEEFWANLTVAPGAYYLRLKFTETRTGTPSSRTVTVAVNGVEMVLDMDVAATAGGLYKAVDLVFNDITPDHGVVEVRIRNGYRGEAALQALEIGQGTGGAGMTPVCLSRAAEPPADGNLLRNPGFEEGVTGAIGSMGEKAEGVGWKYLFPGTTQCYIWGESEFSIHPDWGLPVCHSGAQAVRTHTEGNGQTTIYQETRVSPNTDYAASVWVQAVDLRGQGFGVDPGDSAGLRIQELDAAGKVTAEHPKAELSKAGSYTQLETLFKTGPSTVSVRFVLETVQACKYDQGHVTYDDASLRAR